MQRHMMSHTWKPHEDTKLETIIYTEKNCRLKTMPGQGVMRLKKILLKTPLICFVLVIYCCAWGLTLNVVCIPSETPLKKTNLFFVRGCQLETACRIGMGTCVHLHSQSWVSIWLRPEQVLCTPCACFHDLRVHTYGILVVSRCCFLDVPILSGSYTPSAFSSAWFPEP